MINVVFSRGEEVKEQNLQMPDSGTVFNLESQLAEAFCGILAAGKSPWGTVHFTCEFNYVRGRTDVIASDDSSQMLAFELKLSKWRDALDQAYRNTAFAHCSYVVLPKNTALTASYYEYEFSRRAVGLCYVDDDAVTVLLHPKKQEPILPWLAEVASTAMEEEVGA